MWAYFTLKLGWLNTNAGTNIGPQNNMYLSKVYSILEWCFVISVGVSSDHSQLRCTGFAGSH